MIAKIFVLTFCFWKVALRNVDYCELCSNHTFCKQNPRPSENCLGYDKTAHLTEQDIRDILKRINYSRNYVALQNMRHLPGAANMRKMEWSSELALMAQRWADQCDPNTFPDKLDSCLDIGDSAVGQNVATISGLSLRVNVKTFIDVWFIESLQFSGTVLYYDQFRYNKTNYFTQLIWAETENVGCGRVRFSPAGKNSVFIDRLVCNFGPKGNVHGKPVYIIGFPATQCPENMVPSKEFSGLCSHPEIKEQESAFTNQDIYLKKSLIQNERRPSYGIARTKYKTFKSNAEPENVSFVAVKRSNAELHDEQKNTRLSKIFDHYPDEKGHSRLHNNHNHRIDFDPIHPNANRDYEPLVLSISSSLSQNHRRYNLEKKCTRNYKTDFKLNAITKTKHSDEKLNKCTRGQNKLCPSTLTKLFTLCPCFTQNKQFVFPNLEKTFCDSNVLIEKLNMDRNKNIVARRSNFSMDLFHNAVSKEIENSQDFKNFLRLSQEASLPTQRVTKVNTVLSTPSYSERLRRETEPFTDEPFWKINHPNKMLKDLRYTTISSKKKKNSKTAKNAQNQSTRTTEFITISKDFPVNNKPLTERYLSFDELLHLRKSNTAGFRRSEGNKQSSTTPSKELYEDDTIPANLPNYTLTTGFTHVKYCTRKLTCTWTAAFLTDADGNPKGLNNAIGIGNAYGSRTPVGYVEGCTRTSTCTRDFMYRNKGAELSTVTSKDPNEHADDEDYCERRSLNKRHISKKDISISGNKLKIINKNNTRIKLFNVRVENNKNSANNTKVQKCKR